jgi:two-component system response regulator YcbB
MISKAYEAGVEFYIQKPINSVEVFNVITRVKRLRQIEATFSQLQSIVQTVAPQDSQRQRGTPLPQDARRQKINSVLQSLGISGDSTSSEISRIVLYLADHADDKERLKLSPLCSMFSDNPKTLEQRIRRTITAGLVNLANLGIEDYSNEAFAEYAGTLYQFEQVRYEMNYIRGRAARRGGVSVKRFLYALAFICQNA